MDKTQTYTQKQKKVNKKRPKQNNKQKIYNQIEKQDCLPLGTFFKRQSSSTSIQIKK